MEVNDKNYYNKGQADYQGEIECDLDKEIQRHDIH